MGQFVTENINMMLRAFQNVIGANQCGETGTWPIGMYSLPPLKNPTPALDPSGLVSTGLTV